MSSFDGPAGNHQIDGAFDDVLQFPDIPGPSIAFKYFFTFPAPARWAAAKIPDSVISMPLILLPTDHSMSLFKIHLFREHKV